MKRVLYFLLVLAVPFSASLGFTVSGSVTGAQGFALVFVYTIPATFDTFYVTIANPFNGNYSQGGLDEGGYVLFAFQDSDLNLTPGLDERRGFYGGEVPEILQVSSDLTGINIVLSAPNAGGFSGEITYEGTETGATYVFAHRNADFSGLPAGVGVLFNQDGNGAYTALVDSFGTYYAFAFMDLNTNFQYDLGEPYDFYGGAAPQPIVITQGGQYPDNVNFVLEAVSAAPPVHPVVQEFRLGAPYPNPFNAETTIPFTLDRPMEVELTAYNLLGRQAVTLARGAFSAGEHRVRFGDASLATGVYLIELRSGHRSMTVPVVLLK